ncbi:MAG TPA: lysophospholipid acyltransferase family protein [Solirubrobacteraceae bacterium]|jgi:1-acyl-sn-glycerol-3-phosphate acyltransferase|nr:lysophospholipid acyltransferase family protein [Solirubrobacteraceae bacterium]
MQRSPRQTVAAALSPVVDAYLRMAAAMGEDLASAALAKGRRNPFDLRDPGYIERTLPALRLMSNLYFRASVTGLDNIPAEGPVLLVGNHSGGTWIADTFVFAQNFYDWFGADRRFHQLAHDLVFKLVGLRTLIQRYGTVPASPENMTTALERGSALLVYPGGDEETYRPSWESDKVNLAHRTGFVRLALEHDVPIVPVVAIGGQETALFLGRGRRLAQWLRLDRTLRLKVLPPVLGPPAILTILDLPIRFPLPAKISIEVLEPIDLRHQLGPSPDVEEGYRRVTRVMQDTLTRMGDERTLPVLG